MTDAAPTAGRVVGAALLALLALSPALAATTLWSRALGLGGDNRPEVYALYGGLAALVAAALTELAAVLLRPWRASRLLPVTCAAVTLAVLALSAARADAADDDAPVPQALLIAAAAAGVGWWVAAAGRGLGSALLAVGGLTALVTVGAAVLGRLV